MMFSVAMRPICATTKGDGQYFGTDGQYFGTDGQYFGTKNQYFGTDGQCYGTDGQYFGITVSPTLMSVCPE